MADMYAVSGDNLTEIAQAIRLKRDITDGISVDDMAMQIGLISADSPSYTYEYDLQETITSTSQIVLIDNVEEVSDFIASVIGERGTFVANSFFGIDYKVENPLENTVLFNWFTENYITYNDSEFKMASTPMLCFRSIGTVVQAAPNRAGIRLIITSNNNYKNGIKAQLVASAYNENKTLNIGHYKINIKIKGE